MEHKGDKRAGSEEVQQLAQVWAEVWRVWGRKLAARMRQMAQVSREVWRVWGGRAAARVCNAGAGMGRGVEDVERRKAVRRSPTLVLVG